MKEDGRQKVDLITSWNDRIGTCTQRNLILPQLKAWEFLTISRQWKLNRERRASNLLLDPMENQISIPRSKLKELPSPRGSTLTQYSSLVTIWSRRKQKWSKKKLMTGTKKLSSRTRTSKSTHWRKLKLLNWINIKISEKAMWPKLVWDTTREEFQKWLIDKFSSPKTLRTLQCPC